MCAEAVSGFANGWGTGGRFSGFGLVGQPWHFGMAGTAVFIRRGSRCGGAEAGVANVARALGIWPRQLEMKLGGQRLMSSTALIEETVRGLFRYVA